MRTLTYAGVDFAEFKCWWDGSQVFRKPNKIVNRYQIPYRNGDLIRSTEAFENVEISFNCFIKEDYEENYSNLVNYLNSFDSYQRLETSAEPSIYRMALLHAVIEPETGQFLKDGRFTITFDCMPQEWLKSGEAEMSIDMQTTTYTDPVEVDIEYDDALVDNAVLTLSPVQDLNGQEYPWIDRVGRNKLNLVNMAKTETFCGITFNLTDEGKIYMTGTATDTMNWFPFASIETIPYGTYKISGLPSNMTFGDYGFSTIDSDQHITEHYENNSEVTDTIINFGVWVYEGVTVNNVELKPMIRESTDTSDVWQPYEHTTNICPIYPANGTNHMPSGVDGTYTYAGITVEAKNGVYTITGTATASSYITIPLTESIDLSPSTKQIAFMNTQNLNALQVGFVRDDTRIHYWGMTPINRIAREWTDSGNEVVNKIRISFTNGNVLNCVISPMLMELGDEVTTFVPYRSVVVEQTGKNLLPPTIYNLASNNGAVVSNSAYRSMVVEVTGGETYTISRDIVSGNRFHIYGTETRPAVGVATHIIAQQNSALQITFTTADTDKYILVYLANDGSEITSNIQLETGSTATAYEPYAGTTYTSDLGQFVYGGTVDLVTGVLTVDRAIVYGGNLTWTQYVQSGVTMYYADITDGKPNNTAGGEAYIITSSAYTRMRDTVVTTTTFASADDGYFAQNKNSSCRILVRDSRFSTASDLANWMTETKVQFLYFLATPQTYYLSAQDIALLQGKNYFTSEQPLSVTITEGTTLTNPSYMKARPIIKLNSAGTGTVKLNGDVVVRVTEAPSNTPIYIDCENMNCYSYDEDGNVVNENGNVTLPEGYIEMEKGNNRFTATGQLEPTMIPRWWRL